MFIDKYIIVLFVPTIFRFLSHVFAQKLYYRCITLDEVNCYVVLNTILVVMYQDVCNIFTQFQSFVQTALQKLFKEISPSYASLLFICSIRIF